MSFKLSGGSPTVEADGSAWISSQTDTQAVICVEMASWMVYSGSWVQSSGVVGQPYCQWWGDKQTIFGNGTKTEGTSKHYKYAYFTVDKTSSAQSVYWQTNFHSYIDGTDLGVKQSDYGYVSVPAITYYAPNAPSGLTVTRESDNKNVLSWSAPSTTTTKPVTAQLIERRVDGGAWSQIASVGGSATSYNDTATSPDHSYEYRIRAQNSAGYSGYVTSGTTYNTPAAPMKVTASRLAETTVALAIENASNTATGIEIQRSADKETVLDTLSFDGSPVTDAVDEPGGGTFYYRARNTRGDLVSEWCPWSEPVVTICAPNAPTLKAPASGKVVSKAQETVIFEHAHNPIDGSGQTAAQYRFSTDDGATYDYYDIEGADERLAMENSFAVNSVVTWGVRTKGAHADWGPWSDNRVFFVYQAPTVAFAQPADGFVVENTPIAIQLQYDDPSGSLVSAALNVSDGVKTAYTRNMGADTGGEIQSTEWTPENGKVYTLTATARSSSTLTATATREIFVNFVLPQPAAIHIENDPETGHASLVVYVEEAADLEAPKSISIWRESEDGRVLLGEGLQAGSAVVDRFAPLNTDYGYIVSSFADSGAANSQEFANRVSTDWAFMYFGDSLARCKWNPKWSHDMDPSAEYVHYMGDTYPTAHMDDFMDEVYPVTALVIGRDESRAFRKMMMAREPVVAKLWRGDVFWAVPKLSENPQQGRAEWFEVSVNLNRVEGDAL